EVCIRLEDAHILIVGGPRSGRTSLLIGLARQASSQLEMPVAFYSPQAIKAALPPYVTAIPSEVFADACGLPLADRVQVLKSLDVGHLPDGRLLLFVDDCYGLEAVPDAARVNSSLGDYYRQSLIQPIAVTTPNWVSGTQLTAAMKNSDITVYLKP